MADLSKNRDNLYKLLYDFKVRVKKSSYSRAEFNKFFVNESSFQVLIEWLQNKVKYRIEPFTSLTERTIQDYYKSYVCDDSSIKWSANSSGCKGIINNPPVTDINLYDYVGVYTDKVSKQKITVKLDDGTTLKIIAFGEEANLVPTGTDTFSLTIPLQIITISGSISFVRDSKKKVISLKYKLDNVPASATQFLGDNFKPEGEASKIIYTNDAEKYDPNKWLYFSGQSSSPFPKQKQKDSSSDGYQRTTLKNDVYNVKMPKNIHECDENATEWEIGCYNDKIKFINQKILGRELDGVYTDDLRKALINSNLLDDNATKIPSTLFVRIYRMNLDESKVDKINLKKFYKLVNKKL